MSKRLPSVRRPFFMSESLESRRLLAGATALSALVLAPQAFAQTETPIAGGTLVYLASAESDFVTGQVIVVDGGSVMH